MRHDAKRCPPAVVALAVGLSVGASSCNSFRGVIQCRSVTSTVNTTLAQARDLHEQEPTSQRYRDIAQLLSGLATTLTDLTIADADLKHAVDEYLKQLHRSSRDSDSYAQVLEQLATAKANDDAAAVVSAEGELERIRQRATRSLESAKPMAKRFREACRK
jgi:hypothetical protein